MLFPGFMRNDFYVSEACELQVGYNVVLHCVCAGKRPCSFIRLGGESEQNRVRSHGGDITCYV